MRYLVGRLGYAWAAGIIDGEGCVSAHDVHARNGKTYRQLHLTITQASADGAPPEMLLRMKALFGGWRVVRAAQQVPGTKTRYYWGLSAKATRAALKSVWPWLGEVKRQQSIRTGLVFCN